VGRHVAEHQHYAAGPGEPTLELSWLTPAQGRERHRRRTTVVPQQARDDLEALGDVKGQADFPVGGQLISLLADSLFPCPRSADLLLI
jgi:hypothetical protein